MTEIFYFGSEKVCPQVLSKEGISDIIKKVDHPRFDVQKVQKVKKKQDDYDLESNRSKSYEYTKRTEYEYEIEEIKDPILFSSVHCGGRFSIFKDNKGRLYSVGFGTLGELGLGEYVPYTNTFMKIDMGDSKRTAAHVACGENHTICITGENELFVWGDCSDGKITYTISEGISTPRYLENYKFTVKKDNEPPKKLGSLERRLTTNNTFNSDDKKSSPSSSPLVKKMSFKGRLAGTRNMFGKRTLNLNFKFPRWRTAACGSNFSIVAHEDGVFSFGSDRSGRLGIGPIMTPATVPMQLTFFDGMIIGGVSCGKDHAIAWDINGVTFSWGLNTEGRLGHEIEKDKGFFLNKFEVYPKKITLLENKKVIGGCCGSTHTCVLTDQGEIYTWGRMDSNNMRGKKIEYQLDYFTPTRITVYPMHYEITDRNEPFFAKITCGPTHNIAIDKSGKVYTWGDSSDNCLGFYSRDDIREPKHVASLNGLVVFEAGCGENFTYIIAGDRSLPNQKTALQNLNQRYFETMREKVKVLNEQFHGHHEKTYTGGDSTPPGSPKLIKLGSRNNLDPKLTISFPVEDSARINTTGDYSTLQLQNSMSFNHARPEYSELMKTQSNYTLDKKKQKETWNNKINMIVDDSLSPALPSSQGKRFPILTNALVKSDSAMFPGSPKVELPPLNHLFGPTSMTFDDMKPNSNHNASTKSLKLAYNLTKTEEDELRKMYYQHEQKKIATNPKVVRGLYKDIQTENEQLKYEYIELIRSGRGEEFMRYLLSNPESNQNGKVWDLEIEKMKRKQDKKNEREGNMDFDRLRKKLKKSQIQSKKTKQLLESGQPQVQEIMERIETIYKETEETLDKQYEKKGKVIVIDGHNVVQEYYVKKRDPKEVALEEQHHDFIKSPEKIREDRQKIIEIHDQRMELAWIKKKEIEEIRRQAIIKTFEEHSEHFRKEQKEREMEMQRIFEIKKKMFAYLNAEILIRFLSDVAVNSLKQKRDSFLFNMKARLIQITFRKHQIKRKYDMFTTRKKLMIKKMIMDKLLKKRTRAITLWYLNLKLKTKIKTGLIITRTKAINITRFFKWMHEKMKFDRYLINLDFDRQCLANFKPIEQAFTTNSSPKKGQQEQPPQEINFDQGFTGEFGREFLSLKDDGSTMKKLILLPSILPTTAELKIDINFDPPSHSAHNPTIIRKRNKADYSKQINDQAKADKMDKLRMIGRPFLPLTLDAAKVQMNPAYKMKLDKDVYDNSVQLEAKVKFDFIRYILNMQLRNFRNELKKYYEKLVELTTTERTAINLERARKLLVTSVSKLKMIQKKEDYEIRKRHELRQKYKDHFGMEKAIPKSRSPFAKVEFATDHLPFQTMLVKIAASLPGQTKRPKFYARLPEAYNHRIQLYRERLLRPKKTNKNEEKRRDSETSITVDEFGEALKKANLKL